ncbi:MAG: hypothetical protein RIT81_32145 [Deltaproteobacteria bacterium]
MTRDQFIAELLRVEHGLRRLGADVISCDVGALATPGDLSEIERAVGKKMPAEIRHFALNVAAKVSFHWSLDDEHSDLDPSLVPWGEFSFDLSEIPELEKGRRSWVDTVFPDSNSPSDAVWHNKTAFQAVGNGDLLALDHDERVVYLSHEDGLGHGVIFAPSFMSYVAAGLELAFPGPEDDFLLMFYSKAKSCIDPDGVPGLAWRTLLTREA